MNEQRSGPTLLMKVIILTAVFGVGFFGLWKYGCFSGGGTASSISFGDNVTLKGFVGGEKIGFLEDEEVKSILKSKYGIELDYSKAGSIEMVKDDIKPGTDFLWPSNQVALELFQNKNGNPIQSEIIFSSPIVLYSWDTVVDALATNGLASEESRVYYVNMPRLLYRIYKGDSWKTVGLDTFGKISVISTDPTKSNSGNMFAGLICNANGIVDERTLGTVLPDIKNVFRGMGYLQHSSSDLFNEYLKTGAGSKPVIVGYENQIIEYSIKNSKNWDDLKNKVRVLYPVPTVWSSHTLIVLTPRAKKLVAALQDEKIQKLAWEKHGFRSGTQNDPGILTVPGIPATISKVVPMPSAQVMDTIIDSISRK